MTGQCEKSTHGRSGINRKIRYETTRDTTGGSVPWCPPSGDSPPAGWVQGQRVLDVLPLSTHELSVLLAASQTFGHFSRRFRLGLSVAPPFGLGVPKWRLPTARPTMPSADSCAVSQVPLRFPQFRIRNTTQDAPQVSSVAFHRTALPDLHTWPLMDMDFATSCSLVRPSLPHIRFLFVRSRFCSTIPSDTTSRRCPCALLILRPPSGWIEDFHFPATEHAGHTTKPRSAAGCRARRQYGVLLQLQNEPMSRRLAARRAHHPLRLSSLDVSRYSVP